MRNQFLILIISAYLLMLSSCAQIVAPTGGVRDVAPPKVTLVTPANKSILFNKKRIVIQFDEFIQLNAPEDFIIISPPFETKPTYTNKGKALEIKLNAPLEPNTTYTINFSTAVGDNKENNLLTDYSYVFSTGPQLDSGFISGNLVQAFNNKPEKDITVALYYIDSFTDSTIIKNKPVYLSKTTENGDFRISNLPDKSFKLIAFKDENKNLKVDKTEEIAFIENVVKTADTSLRPYLLRLFKPSPYQQGHIVDTFNREPDKFVLAVYKPKTVEITRTTDKPVYIKKITGKTNTDTFHVFTKMNAGDTAVILTVNNQSVNIKYKPIFKTEKLTYTLNKQPELNDTFTIRFNNPILKADTSRLKLFKDSVQIDATHLFTNSFEYKITHNWLEKTNYTLEILDSAFIDLFNQYSKKDKAPFTSKSLKDYGTLLLHVKFKNKPEGQLIFQLTDENEQKIFYQYILEKSTDIQLEYVTAGSYKVKWIYDTNANGEWDNGEFTLKKQPEKVGYFKENINIKAYWDLEQSILIE